MTESRNTPARYGWTLAALLILCTYSFYPVFENRFITFFDDNDYVTQNSMVQKGLTTSGLKWAFTTFHAANWHPLTWISHMADVQFFGNNPAWHHFTNTLFHSLNTLLLFLLLTRLTGSLGKSAIVASLFAVHPLHVEPVAWISERKELLSTFFGFLSLISYSSYAARGRKREYTLALIFFLLSLLSKPMLVTLPFLLLLLDYWPLKRLHSPGKNGYKLLVEKTPFLLLSMTSAAITLYAQKSWGAVQLLDDLPLSSRLANAVISYCAYLFKALIPLNLAVFYPHPKSSTAAMPLLFSLLLLLFITFMVFKKKVPVYTLGWLWYLGTLFPVIGLVQAGNQAMADRYTYLPLTGIFLMAVWGVDEAGRSKMKRAPLLFYIALIFIYSSLTQAQLRHWKSNLTLFQRAVNVTDNNSLAHNHLGSAFLQEKMLAEAEKHFLAAIRADPGYPTPHNNLANTFMLRQDFSRATHHYKMALEIEPEAPFSRYNLGVALLSLKRGEDAAKEFKKAVVTKPDFTAAYIALGTISVSKKNIREAKGYFNKALTIDPGNRRALEYMRRTGNE